MSYDFVDVSNPICNAIAASIAEGQSGSFIDFMLNEILKTLQKSIKEEEPNNLPNKVPNKSELSVLRLLADNPRLTRIENAEKVDMTDNGIRHIMGSLNRRSPSPTAGNGVN